MNFNWRSKDIESNKGDQGYLQRKFRKITARLLLICLIFYLLVCASGCLSTLYPFFKEKDVVFDPELIGNWNYVNKEEKGSIFFEQISQSRSMELFTGIRKISNKGYLVTKKDSVGHIRSQDFVFLARIGKYFYMDFYGANSSNNSQVNQEFRNHTLRFHSCYKINFYNNHNFEMKLFEASFLFDLIEKKQIRMHYEENNPIEKKKVITASTDELQQYLLKYSDNPKAYNEDNSLKCTRALEY